MKVLVCIKAVPDGSADYRINAAGTGYDETGLVFRVNEYDLFAMEEAVRIRERLGEVEIEAVTVGPPRVEAQLRKAMGLGADGGVVIDDSDAPATDALSVASLIAAWAQDREFDLILTGVMSEDLQRCQTGPMIAQLLGLPAATTVIAMELLDAGNKLACERELEGGLRERVELSAPALVSVQSGINEPRYASLSNVLRVRKLEIPVIDAGSLGPTRRCEGAGRAYLPESGTGCEIIEGGLEETAAALIEEIRARVPVV